MRVVLLVCKISSSSARCGGNVGNVEKNNVAELVIVPLALTVSVEKLSDIHDVLWQ